MTTALPVTGTVQHYAWGDPTYLPRLLGVEPDGRPWAELWLGTHPNGPTMLADGVPLDDVTGPLPYLLKVLCAAEPLSMQCHPDAARARVGHAEGIYPDPHAKPELIVALTTFRALCGIRPVEDTVDALRASGAGELAGALEHDGVAGTLEALYRGRLDPARSVRAVLADGSELFGYAADLERRYPGDPSVAVALLLNHVTLEPGDALHLAAGNLHAYLYGCGVELMGASDNVVRGGLTPKHVDVDELLRIVDPTPLADPIMEGSGSGYPLPEAAVTLRSLAPDTSHESTGRELLVAMDGTTRYLPPGASWQAEATTWVVVEDAEVVTAD